MTPIVVAIDGPSGVGKSTVARGVSARLGIPHLDTGKMYRAIALGLADRGVDLENEEEVRESMSGIALTIAEGLPRIDGHDIGRRILSEEAGRQASLVSRYEPVRNMLVALQRTWGAESGGVLEGRDIGCRVFPDTPYKFYLHAPLHIRAWRRWLQIGGDPADVAADVASRDLRDKSRERDPLKLLPDHVPVDTGSLTAEKVVDVIVDCVGMKRMRGRFSP